MTGLAAYNFRQNVTMQINHSMRSGSSYDAQWQKLDPVHAGNRVLIQVCVMVKEQD